MGFIWWYSEFMLGYFQELCSGCIDEILLGWIYFYFIFDNYVLFFLVLWWCSVWDCMGGFLMDNQQIDDWEYFVWVSMQYCFVWFVEFFVLYCQYLVLLFKCIFVINIIELMCMELICCFGMSLLLGYDVDFVVLCDFQYKGWCNFVDVYCVKGDLGLGLRIFV